MRHKIIAGFIFLLCAIGIVFFHSLAEGLLYGGDDSPAARQGLLDLTKYEFGSQGVVELDGEWEFYEGRLLHDSELRAGLYDPEKRIVQVPGPWDGYDLSRSGPQAFGYGTYRLRVLLHGDAGGIVGIKTTSIGLSHRIAVNGRLIGGSGIPGVDSASYIPGNIPYAAFFQPDGAVLDIVVWVANFDYQPAGGIVNSLFLGTQQGIAGARETAIANDVAMAAAFFITGLFSFSVFAFRRQEMTWLSFALFNSFSGLYVLNHGEKLLGRWFPLMDYRLFAKLQYLSAAVATVAFLLYLYYTFPTLFRKLYYKALIGIAWVFVIVGLVAPLAVHSVWSAYQPLFVLAAMLISVYVLTVGILQGIEGAFFVGLSSFAILLMAIIATLNVLGKVHIGMPLVGTQMLFILSHGALLAARLSMSIDKAQQLARELMIADKHKDEFLAKTSHEFKTPLHGIINITKLFLEQEKRHLAEEQRQSLTLVIDTAVRLSKLVNDILDMARMKEGKLHIETDILDVRQELKAVVDVCAYVYEGHTNILSYDDPGNPLFIKADPNRFKQIIYNLIDNAMTHTSNGAVTLKASNADGFVAISVEDKGPGIAPEKRDSIFEPFVQLQTDAYTGQAGLGLGLAIVKQLTELQGGLVRLHATEAGGSCFTLLFPALQDAPGETARSAARRNDSQEWPSQQRCDFTLHTPHVVNPDGEGTIIIADDSMSNLKILTDALAAGEHRIVAVKNGREALEQIWQAKDLVLVILDIMMPDMSGYEVCLKIRERFNLAELPVLMLTAAIQAVDVETALKLGANDYLQKPFNLDELKARVNSLVMMKQAASSSAAYEIAFLHAQIKPHFLYNALNTIAESCETDPEEAGNLILSLSRYLRNTLDFANLGSLVALEVELATVRAYLELEKARYEDLVIEWDVADDADILLPPMILQTLVENAVKHGAVKSSGAGTVRIGVAPENGGVLFTVEDNGPGMARDQLNKLLAAPAESESIGLYNINTRLMRLYGRGLSFAGGSDGGTKVSFFIPDGGKAYAANHNR